MVKIYTLSMFQVNYHLLLTILDCQYIANGNSIAFIYKCTLQKPDDQSI